MDAVTSRPLGALAWSIGRAFSLANNMAVSWAAAAGGMNGPAGTELFAEGARDDAADAGAELMGVRLGITRAGSVGMAGAVDSAGTSGTVVVADSDGSLVCLVR